MTDERKPLPPDRPGRYLLRDGRPATVHVVEQSSQPAPEASIAYGATMYGQWHDGAYHDDDDGPANPDWDIVAHAPDDAEWCLRQARTLIAAVPKYMIIARAIFDELTAEHVAAEDLRKILRDDQAGQ